MIEFKGEKGSIKELKIKGTVSEVLTEFGMLLEEMGKEMPEEVRLFFIVLQNFIETVTKTKEKDYADININ